MIYFVPQLRSRVATPFNRKGQPVTTFVRFNVLTIQSVNINSYLDGRDGPHGQALFKVWFCSNFMRNLAERFVNGEEPSAW